MSKEGEEIHDIILGRLMANLAPMATKQQMTYIFDNLKAEIYHKQKLLCYGDSGFRPQFAYFRPKTELSMLIPPEYERFDCFGLTAILTRKVLPGEIFITELPAFTEE